jgi:hypothetical protein
VLVLGHRKNSESDRKFASEQDGLNAIESFRCRSVDFSKVSISASAAENLGVKHLRQKNVIRKNRLADAFGNRVDFS